MTGTFFASNRARNISKETFSTSNANDATRQVAQARSHLEALQLDVERLLMITEALWSILKQEHGYSDEHLFQMVQEIDLRDGKLDGKVGKQGNPVCPECGRTLIGKHPKCLYCGTAVERDPFER